jgi:hypothetical protein
MPTAKFSFVASDWLWQPASATHHTKRKIALFSSRNPKSYFLSELRNAGLRTES